MNDSKKPVIMHFHIFKNAGSTIDWILKKNFSKQALFMDDRKNREAILQWDEIIEFLNKHPEAKSFSSHQIRFPIPENPEFNFIPMVFIRHPIDRAFSIYSFKRRSKDDSKGTQKATSMTVQEFIKWNLETKGYHVMKNFQVIFLSNKELRSPAEDTDYDPAVNWMKSSPILGVVERLDESLVLAEEYLRHYFEDIDLSYVKQNVSSDRKGNLEQRLEESRLQIGEELMTSLNDFNKLDQMLHVKANEELDIRLKNVENFDEKMSDFIARCEKLALVA